MLLFYGNAASIKLTGIINLSSQKTSTNYFAVRDLLIRRATCKNTVQIPGISFGGWGNFGTEEKLI